MSNIALTHDKISTGMAGGWQTNCPVSKEDMVIFHEAMKNIMGLDYKPFAVAKQVVNGMNYIFIATAHPVIPNPPEGIAKILIRSMPASSAPQLISIGSFLGDLCIFLIIKCWALFYLTTFL